MGSLVEMGLANALLAGALAVLALVVGRYSRRPALVHSLWLLVLLKLVTPPLIPLPIPGLAAPVPAEPGPPATAPEAAAGPVAQASLPVELSPAGQPATGSAVAAPPVMNLAEQVARAMEAEGTGVALPPPMPPMPGPAGATSEAPASPPAPPVPASLVAEEPPVTSHQAPITAHQAVLSARPSVSLADLLVFAGWVWAAGAVVVFLFTLWRMVRFQRLLRFAHPAPQRLADEAQAMAGRLGLSRCPGVWLIPGPVPPLLWAPYAGSQARLFFPALLLPRLDDKGRTALLVHELAHLARRDHWVRWLELLVGCLYWWYPLVWLARSRLRAAEEECCDAWVTSSLPDNAPAYAGALLETVDFLSRVPAPLPPAASGFGRVHQLKRRLTMIVRGSTPPGLPLVGKLLVLLLAVPLVPTLARPVAPPSDQKSGARSQEPGARARAAEQPMAGGAVELPDEPTSYQPNSRALQGSGGNVWFTAISPDGKTLAVVVGGVGENEGALTLYDFPSGKERVTLIEPKPIRCVAFSPDGKHLATGDFSMLAHLRDPRTGAVRQVLRGHTGAVNSVSFTADSKRLVTGSLDNTLKVWDVPSGKNTHTLTGHTNWVLSVHCGRDGKTLISVGRDMAARIWDVPTFKVRHVLKGRNQWIEGCALSPDGKTAATTCVDGVVQLWDAETGKHLHDITAHGGSANVPVFLQDGKKLATCSHDRTIRFFDVETGMQEAVIETSHTNIIYGLAASPDGKWLVSGAWDQVVKVWDVEKRQEKMVLRPRRYRPENNYPLLALACSPDGKLLAVSGEEKVVKLLDAATGRALHLLEGHDDAVGRVAFSPDGKTLATAGFDRNVILWDVEKGTKKKVLEGHTDSVYSVAFSPDGKWLASGSFDRTVRLWEAGSGKHVATFKHRQGSIRAVAFSPDSTKLASGGADKSIRLWDVARREALLVLKGHDDAVRSVAFSPDGKRILSGAEDSTVRLWDIASGKQIGMYRSNGVVREAAFSPRGRSVATVSEDRGVRILDPDTLTQRMLQFAHTEAATCLAYAPDARALFTGGSDRIIRHWQAAIEARSALLTLRSDGKQMWVASYSPDGKWLATGGADRLLRVLPARQGARRWSAQGAVRAVLGLSVSPDGKTLAGACADGTIRLWDRDSGKLRASLAGHKYQAWLAVFSPDGRKLASVAGPWQQNAADNGQAEARVWDLTTNREIGELPGHISPVMAVAWSPDGKMIVTGMRNGGVRLFDAASRKELRVLPGHKEGARAAVFSPEGRYLATGGFDGKVRIWEVASGKEVAVLQGPDKGVNAVAWSADGRHLAAVSRPGEKQEPGEVRLWSISREDESAPAFRQRAVLKGHTAHVLSCAFSPDSKTLASAGGVYSSFGEVILWDVATGKERMLLHGHRQWVEALAFSKDSRTLYSGGGTYDSPGEVRAWLVEDAGWWVPNAHKGQLCCAAWSKDGKLLATGCTAGTIKVWAPATGKLQASLTGHKKMVRCLAISPDGQTLASVSEDRTVKLWDLTTNQEQAELARHRRAVNGVAFSPDGKLLATSSADPTGRERGGEIKVFDTQTGKERTGAEWAEQPALSVAFSPDGKHLAAAGTGPNALKIYDVPSGRLVRTVMGAHSIRMIAYSPDGKRLASAHGTGSTRGNGSIQVWDTTTWQEALALTGHRSLCLAIGFAPDGRRLASASTDGTVKLWDLAPARPAGPRMVRRAP